MRKRLKKEGRERRRDREGGKGLGLENEKNGREEVRKTKGRRRVKGMRVVERRERDEMRKRVKKEGRERGRKREEKGWVWNI